MTTHKVVPHDAWVAARKKHLAKEKEFTHLRDQLSRERRELPWELVDKEYIFEGESGKVSLQDLFAGRSQRGEGNVRAVASSARCYPPLSTTEPCLPDPHNGSRT